MWCAVYDAARGVVLGTKTLEGEGRRAFRLGDVALNVGLAASTGGSIHWLTQRSTSLSGAAVSAVVKYPYVPTRCTMGVVGR